MALPVLPPASAGGMSRFAPKSNLMSESPAVLSVRPVGIGMRLAQCGGRIQDGQRNSLSINKLARKPRKVKARCCGQAIGAGASTEQKRLDNPLTV